MIGLPRGRSVYLFDEPVDVRKSFNTLSSLVEQQMKQVVTAGDLFLFVSRNRKRSKVLYFDGMGLCLFCKRLEQGQFHAPWKMRRKEMTLGDLALFIIQSTSQSALQWPNTVTTCLWSAWLRCSIAKAW